MLISDLVRGRGAVMESGSGGSGRDPKVGEVEEGEDDGAAEEGDQNDDAGAGVTGLAGFEGVGVGVVEGAGFHGVVGRDIE